jgi:hypothetical protein
MRAELDHLALDRHAAHAQHVVHGEAVLQAVHAAGVLGHVAADGAGDLARRIGRVVQAEGRGGLADGQVAHARLHDRRARVRVKLDDAVELRQRQQHAGLVRQRAAAQPGAGAARHHRCAELVARAQHLYHLGFSLRQCHHHRHLPVQRQAVALVRAGVLLAEQQRVRGQQRTQRGHHLALAGDVHRAGALERDLRGQQRWRRGRRAAVGGEGGRSGRRVHLVQAYPCNARGRPAAGTPSMLQTQCSLDLRAQRGVGGGLG